MYGHTYSKSIDQPGKVANPARGQLNRKTYFSLSPFAHDNLVSRGGFGSPVARQPARLHTQAMRPRLLHISLCKQLPKERLQFCTSTLVGGNPTMNTPRLRRGGGIASSSFILFFTCFGIPIYVVYFVCDSASEFGAMGSTSFFWVFLPLPASCFSESVIFRNLYHMFFASVGLSLGLFYFI